MCPGSISLETPSAISGKGLGDVQVWKKRSNGPGPFPNIHLYDPLLGPRIERFQQFLGSLRVEHLVGPGCLGVRMAAGVGAGPGAGLGDRLWRWLDQCKCRSLQSKVYISGGRGAGRGGLRDTVERRLPVHGHCEGEREEQEGELGTERPGRTGALIGLPSPTRILWEHKPIGGDLPKPPKARAFLA